MKSHDIILCFTNFQENGYSCGVFIFLEQDLKLLNLYSSPFIQQ